MEVRRHPEADEEKRQSDSRQRRWSEALVVQVLPYSVHHL